MVVCKKKVITEELGRRPLIGLIALLAVHYLFRWEFNSSVKEVLEFIQEKLLQDPLPKQKQSIAYTNLFRVVSCFEVEIKYLMIWMPHSCRHLSMRYLKLTNLTFCTASFCADHAI